MKSLTRLFWVITLAAFLTGCAFATQGTSGSPPAGTTPPVVTNPLPTQVAAATPTNTAIDPTQTAAEPAAPTPSTPPQPSEPPVVPSAQALPDPGGYQWAVVASGLSSPVGAAAANDGTNRIFIIEKAGRIQIIENDSLASSPYLDITDRVGSGGSEQGLLGLAFHPRFAENGYFYVYYTDRNGDTVISRFQGSRDQADPASEKVLVTQDQPYENHNGGGLAFGPDGYLYASLGDGGAANDPHHYGQSTDTLLGKLLRIDVDNGDPYGIPADNPFASGGGRLEIWGYGLRNAWRFAFDPATGDLYIADVGQNQYEEVNFIPAGTPGGLNFGWNHFEGQHEFEGHPPAGAALVTPVAEYDHGSGCSITGGHVYRGHMPEWQGVYFYGDWCSGTVWGLLRLPDGTFQNNVLFQGLGNITAFGQDEAGEVYLVDYSGSILRLDANR